MPVIRSFVWFFRELIRLLRRVKFFAYVERKQALKRKLPLSKGLD